MSSPRGAKQRGLWITQADLDASDVTVRSGTATAAPKPIGTLTILRKVTASALLLCRSVWLDGELELEFVPVVLSLSEEHVQPHGRLAPDAHRRTTAPGHDVINAIDQDRVTLVLHRIQLFSSLQRRQTLATERCCDPCLVQEPINLRIHQHDQLRLRDRPAQGRY